MTDELKERVKALAVEAGRADSGGSLLGGTGAAYVGPAWVRLADGSLVLVGSPSAPATALPIDLPPSRR